MTVAELVEEFHDWPGCEHLTDEQITTLIAHFRLTNHQCSKSCPSPLSIKAGVLIRE